MKIRRWSPAIVAVVAFAGVAGWSALARGSSTDGSVVAGSPSGPSAAANDRGRLNVTLHHNWFEDIEDRSPRVRFGNIHIFNDYVNGATNATISVAGAVTLVERCVFRDTRIATTFSHAADNEDKDRGGTITIVDSRNIDPRSAATGGNTREQFEIDHNFQSNVPPEELKFNAPTGWKWDDLSKPPYAYSADPVDAVPDLVQRYAGTGKVSLP